MDVHDKKTRKYNMSQIKGKDTKPELIVRKFLWVDGFRYRKNVKDLPGKPDIVFIGKKKVIFINGCFWHHHECKYFKWPKTNDTFWRDKILRTVERDKKNMITLRELGWDILIVWECQIKDNFLQVKKDLKSFLK